MALGAIEAKFFDRLRDLLGLADDPAFDDQYDRTRWDAMRSKLGALFLTRPLDHWSALLGGEDVCFAPVIPIEQAPDHPHNRARGAFVEVDGIVQPAPAPRFSDTEPVTPRMWRKDADKAALLGELGFDAAEAAQLARDGAFGR